VLEDQNCPVKKAAAAQAAVAEDECKDAANCTHEGQSCPTIENMLAAVAAADAAAKDNRKEGCMSHVTLPLKHTIAQQLPLLVKPCLPCCMIHWCTQNYQPDKFKNKTVQLSIEPCLTTHRNSPPAAAHAWGPAQHFCSKAPAALPATPAMLHDLLPVH
jgi:hypothetical protein